MICIDEQKEHLLRILWNKTNGCDGLYPKTACEGRVYIGNHMPLDITQLIWKFSINEQRVQGRRYFEEHHLN
jgi:hypothetical protein